MITSDAGWLYDMRLEEYQLFEAHCCKAGYDPDNLFYD